MQLIEMNNPKISVVVPVYKAESFLPDTLESLLRQEYDNFEVVLVDDGSPDGSGIICDNYATKDSRVVVFHKENGGVTSARRLGVEKATGDWVIFVDADDQLREGALAFFVETAIKYKADMVITPNLRYKNGSWVSANMLASGVYDRKGYLHLLGNRRISSGIGGKLIRKGLFSDDTLDLPKSITNNEDLLMNFRLSRGLDRLYCDNSQGFYMYFVREGSASLASARKNDWESLYKTLAAMRSECGDSVSDYIVLSISDCLLAGFISQAESKEYVKLCKWRGMPPLRHWSRLLFICHPNKLTRFVEKVTESIYFRLK